MLDALVIGAGPAGLATAAMLRRRGVDVRIVDREAAIGGAFTRMNPDVTLITPSRLVAMPGFALPPGPAYLGATAYRDYLIAFAAEHHLVAEARTVLTVRRAGRNYRALFGDGDAVETSAVVVATGMFDFPARPALAGDPTVPVIHAAEWRSSHAQAGRHVLVLGGSTSGVEISEIAARAGCRVTLATRRLSIARQAVLGVDLTYLLLPIGAHVRPRKFCEGEPPPGTDRGFAKLRKQGAIVVRPPLVRLDGNRAVFAGGGGDEHVDLVVQATGYRFTSAFLPGDLARTPRGTARCAANESISHAGIYFVGSPCARSAASQFLYGIARDADSVAAAIADR